MKLKLWPFGKKLQKAQINIIEYVKT